MMGKGERKCRDLESKRDGLGEQQHPKYKQQ
jgi:hypothetical protein